MTLIVRESADVLVLAFSAPATRNALDDGVVDELHRALDAAAARDDLRGVVLTGDGGHFSAGGDFRQLAALVERLETEGADAVARQVRRNAEVVERLLELPVPTVAALSGAVIGAALGIACACDARVADASVRIGTGFARLGLSSDLGTGPLLTAVAGEAGEQLLRDARVIELEEALRLGLVTRAATDVSVLTAAIEAVGTLGAWDELPSQRRAKTGSPGAFRRALDHEAAAFASSLGSAEARQRIATRLSGS